MSQDSGREWPCLLDSDAEFYGIPWTTLRRHIEVAAVRAHRRHNEVFPIDDYLSAGLLAVAECLQRYDVGRAVSFSRYADSTIRYAMMQVPIDLGRGVPVTWGPLNDQWPVPPPEAPPPGPDLADTWLAHCTRFQAYCARRCWLDGQSLSVVARELGCHRSNVLRRLAIARRRLLDALAPTLTES